MPEITTRKVEVISVGQWLEIPFKELKVGDLFRMFEDTGTPVDGGQICIVTKAAYMTPTADRVSEVGMFECEAVGRGCEIVVDRDGVTTCACKDDCTPCKMHGFCHLCHEEQLSKDHDKKVKELEDHMAELESHTAASNALDEIAKLCGCPEWEYPGQVVRDVEAKLKLIPRVTVKTTVTAPGDDDG